MDIQTDSSGCEHSSPTHLLLKPVCAWRVALKGQELKQLVLDSSESLCQSQVEDTQGRFSNCLLWEATVAKSKKRK